MHLCGIYEFSKANTSVAFTRVGWLILIPSGDAFGVFESMIERDSILGMS